MSGELEAINTNMGKGDLQRNKSKEGKDDNQKAILKGKSSACIWYNPCGELVPWWEVMVCSCGRIVAVKVLRSFGIKSQTCHSLLE